MTHGNKDGGDIMLILINAIVSFIGAFLGALVYFTIIYRKPDTIPLVDLKPYQELPEAPAPQIKRKRRTADEIAIAKDRAIEEKQGIVTRIAGE